MNGRQLQNACFAWASRILEGRVAGRRIVAPDWLEPQAICWIAMAPDRPELRVGLRPGIPARALPARLALGGGLFLTIRPMPGQSARAQVAPRMVRATPPIEQGTATCLVRDRLNPDRNYQVTCGHVLAPTHGARWDDGIEIRLPTAGGTLLELPGRLREWVPTGSAQPPANIDAGLTEIEPVAVQHLREIAADWIPVGLSDNTYRDRSVVLKRYHDEIEGSIKLKWSGEVRLPDGGEGSTRFLNDALGYSTVEPTEGGDSGAPVWSTSQELLGMHVGAIDPEGGAGANAIMCRIAPVLDWYCVKAYTRDDPATLDDRPPPGSLPRMAHPPASAVLNMPAGMLADDEIQMVAKTLWGEARGEGEAGMAAVANVIINRLKRKYRGCDTAAEVCLDPQQFSCWNCDDPNRAKLTRLHRNSSDGQYQQALQIAETALRGGLRDETGGALHYVAGTLRNRPKWLDGKIPSAVIGNHQFYNNIA